MSSVNGRCHAEPLTDAGCVSHKDLHATVTTLTVAVPDCPDTGRTKLMTEILPAEYVNIHQQLNQRLDDVQDITLALDGWKSPRKQSIYSFIIILPAANCRAASAFTCWAGGERVVILRGSLSRFCALPSPC
jgi:hypothetical protein